MTQPVEQALPPATAPDLDVKADSGANLLPPPAAVHPRGLDYLCVAIVIWLAHFTLFRRFGFYEDDYYCYVRTLDWHWPQMWAWIKLCFHDWPHGRPLGWTLMSLLPWSAYKVGGLHAPFVFGYLIVTANALLMLRLLERTCSQPVPIIGALAFALFPADTTRAILIHNMLLQPAMFMALLSAHAWLSRRYVVAYAMAALVLTTYESAILPVMLIPLLGARWNWQTLRRLILHGAATVAVLGALLAIRMKMGEGRVAEAKGDPELLYKVVTGFWIGARTSVWSYFDRVSLIDTVKDDRNWSFVPWLVLALTGWHVWTAMLAARCDADRGIDRILTWGEIGRTAVVAALMLLISYTMSFTHYPPDNTYGRMTSVHLAASVGAAIFIATLASALVLALNRVRLDWVVALVLAVWFADLSQFGVSVQRGLATSVRDQRTFWTSVLRLCPDMTAGTVIILDDQILPNTWYAPTSSWADVLVLPTLFRFPTDATPPMFVSRGGEEWRDKVEWRGERLYWKNAYFGFNNAMELPQRNVILLRQKFLEFSRETGAIRVQGRPLELKPMPTTRTTVSYPHAKLYPMLVDERRLLAP